MRSDDTERIDLPAEESPAVYRIAEPRYLGVTPRVLAAALAVAAAVAGLALVALGGAVAGALLLVAALLLAAAFGALAHGRNETAFDRRATAAVDRTLELAGFTRSALGVWGGAGRRAAQLRLELRGLTRARGRLQYELGGAVYEHDAARVVELSDQLRETDARLRACSRELQSLVPQARQRIRREQGAVATTEIRRPG
jgi:hypothetical protein